MLWHWDRVLWSGGACFRPARADHRVRENILWRIQLISGWALRMNLIICAFPNLDGFHSFAFVVRCSNCELVKVNLSKRLQFSIATASSSVLTSSSSVSKTSAQQSPKEGTNGHRNGDDEVVSSLRRKPAKNSRFRVCAVKARAFCGRTCTVYPAPSSSWTMVRRVTP